MDEEFRDNKAKSIPKILFLDQNQWIPLARVYYKKDQNPTLIRILSKIDSLILKGKLVIPLNTTNLEETGKRQNEDSRKRLAEFQVQMSRGLAFVPHYEIIPFEIFNFLSRASGKEKVPIRNLALQKGIPPLIGTEPKIKDESIEKSKLEKVQNFFKSPEAVKGILGSYLPPNEQLLSNYVKNTEKIRENQIKIKDKKTRERAILEDHLKSTLIPIVEKACEILRIHREEVFPKSQCLEELQKFACQFPTNYILHCLLFGRDSDTNRKVDPHDLFDVISFLIPIAYFDYAVGEKYFIGIAQRAGLGTLYGTVLLTKIEDLEPILDELLRVE